MATVRAGAVQADICVHRGLDFQARPVVHQSGKLPARFWGVLAVVLVDLQVEFFQPIVSPHCDALGPRFQAGLV